MSSDINIEQNIIKKTLTGCTWWRRVTTYHMMCRTSLDPVPPVLVKTRTNKHIRTFGFSVSAMRISVNNTDDSK